MIKRERSKKQEKQVYKLYDNFKCKLELRSYDYCLLNGREVCYIVNKWVARSCVGKNLSLHRWNGINGINSINQAVINKNPSVGKRTMYNAQLMDNQIQYCYCKHSLSYASLLFLHVCCRCKKTFLYRK